MTIEATKISHKIKSGMPVKYQSKETGDIKYFLTARDCSKVMGYSPRWCDKIISSHDGETKAVKMEYVTLEEVKNNLKYVEIDTLFDLVKYWFIERNMHSGDPSKQMLKLFEEASEIGAGISKNQPEEIKDGIGDTLVVLIGLSMQLGIDIKEALEMAFTEIKDRKGKLINGVFVKQEDLDEDKAN